MAPPAASLPLFGTDRPPPTEAMASADVAGPNGTATPPPPRWSGPIVRTAWPVLMLIGRITAGSTSTDTELLRAAFVDRIRQFEQAALALGIAPRDTSAARYALCSAADEAVLLSAWGRASGWNQNTLLSRFHGETWGGEKVFTLVERVLQAPDQHPDLIELLHTILLLGFQGRFRVERDGTAQADAVRNRLFRATRTRIRTASEIVPPIAGGRAPRGSGRIRTPLPIWTAALLCVVVVLCVFGGLRESLQRRADAVARTIDALVPMPVPTAPVTPTISAVPTAGAP